MKIQLSVMKKEESQLEDGEIDWCEVKLDESALEQEFGSIKSANSSTTNTRSLKCTQLKYDQKQNLSSQSQSDKDDSII